MDVSFGSCSQYFADGIYPGVCGAGAAVYSSIQRRTGTEDEICILLILPTTLTCVAWNRSDDILRCCKVLGFDNKKH